MWDNFFVILDEVGVSSCRRCQQLYKFGGSNGTSGMTRHVPKCTPSTRPPPPAAKARAEQADIKWVTETMKSSESEENPALVEFIQTAVDIGRSHGAVKSADLLPSADRVSEGIRTEAEEVRDVA